MKRKHFDASVCRESDRHNWRWFISYQQGGEWYSCLFDATPQGLEDCVKMTDTRELMYSSKHNTREVIDAYFHACDLNAKLAA